MRETEKFRLKDLIDSEFMKIEEDPKLDIQSFGYFTPRLLGEAMDRCLYSSGYSYYGDPFFITPDAYEVEISVCIVRHGIIDAMMVFDEPELDGIRLSLLFSTGDDVERDLMGMAAFAVDMAKDKYGADTVFLMESGDVLMDKLISWIPGN